MSKVRRVAGWFAIVAMLFAQLAVAAYACPLGSPQAASVELAPTSHCERLDAALTHLCLKYCHDAEQPQGASPSPAPFAPAFIVHVEPAAQVSIARLEQHAMRRVHPPPLTIRNCCLRL